MTENYLATGLLNVLVLLSLGYMVQLNEGMERGRKSSFLLALFATVAVILAELGTDLLGGPNLLFRPYHIVCNVIGFSLSPVIPILLASVFSGERVRLRSWRFLPSYINCALALLSPAYGLIFRIPADNAYQRGFLFLLYVLAYLWGMLVLLKTMSDEGRRYQYRSQFKLFFMFAIFLLGTTVQIALPTVHTAWTCVTLTMALYYGFVCEFHDKFDALTKLYNRKSYESELERLGRKPRFAVIVMDVDDFKRVNDLYGHPYGDECLFRLASLIYEAFHKIGVCYRIGGDEFCVLCTSAEEEKISAAVQLLLRKIDTCRAQDPRLPVLSFGYQICGEASAQSIAAAVQEADRQMYAHKARHKEQSV